VRVAHGDEVDVAAREELAVCLGVLVDADGHDGQIGPLVMKLDEGGHLFNAGRAPCCPEVEQHHAAAVVGQVNARGSIGDGEVRG
jgi:hypothetical protein